MKNQVIARAWVLESGRDCDGVCSMGKVISCPNIEWADLKLEDAMESSDGYKYKITENWSDLLEYCIDHELDINNYAFTN